MEDYGIPQSNIGKSADIFLVRAEEQARRRSHPELLSDHLFLAFAELEWELFEEIMKDFGLSPREILREVKLSLEGVRKSSQDTFTVSKSVKLIMGIANQRATRWGRSSIESKDIFPFIFEDLFGGPTQIMKSHGIDHRAISNQILEKLKKIDGLSEKLIKIYELPPFLKHFSTNLNLLARQNKIPFMFGREDEIKRTIEILSHRGRPNSAMLIGEPGVGKTAIAEGLARMIEFEPDKIPIRLRDCQVISLALNSLVAGTMLRGMFEDRMQNVLRELRENPRLILFVDEAHTLIGAGSALGAPSDAANILKGVLARGEVRIIGATTLSEYKEFIKEDEALSRRFVVVFVSEPTIEETRNILLAIQPNLEDKYGVKIQKEAIDIAIELSPRYMRHLRLPDKAIGWLDTAAVRAEIGGGEVTSDVVMGVIADNAQIPRNMVSRKTGYKLSSIVEAISQRVVGQTEAISATARRIIMNKGPLKDGFNRPDGVLLFLGPTGVGKTELAKSLAHFLFGDEGKMIRLDMSEYGSSTTGIDKLIGMPRGIVGADRGGVLTNALRDSPYSVVLLDEVEKADQDLLNIFLSAFDEGWITDGKGKRVYLSDAIIIMTSNLGAGRLRSLTSPMGFSLGQTNMSQIKADIMKDVKKRFSPEFMNRIDDVVIFSPLNEDEVRQIAVRYIATIEARLAQDKKSLVIDDDALDKIVERGFSLAFGARGLKRRIDEDIKMPIGQQIDEAQVFHAVLRDGEIIVEGNGFDMKANGPLALS